MHLTSARLMTMVGVLAAMTGSVVRGALIVPALNSDPGAPVNLYLDFSGTPAEFWGYNPVPSTPAFSTDSDTTTFSSADIVGINTIWSIVSEAFSPFNVNVTTVDPGAVTTNGDVEYPRGVDYRVVIGGNGSWAGGDEGGVTFIGAFTDSGLPNTSYVFSQALGNNAILVGEATAHELGHALGLYHQSIFNGDSLVQEYNPGNSATAPIMGQSYYAVEGRWWYGVSDAGAPVVQDDAAVIADSTNGFGYRPQDHGQTIATADPLTVNDNTLTGSGVISQLSDTDTFSFSTRGGDIALTADVAPYGAMLQPELLLEDAAGDVLVTADNAATLDQSITDDVPSGTYYLVVESDQHDSGISENEGYSLGEYTIDGTAPPLPEPCGTGLLAATNLLAGRRPRR